MDDNMTVGQFMAYTQVYPYTKDAFHFEQAMSKANMLATYIDCYNELAHSYSLSDDVLDMLIVESSAESKYLEEAEVAFMEALGKGGGLLGNLFKRLGGFLRSFFPKLLGANGNCETLEQKIRTGSETLIQNISNVANGSAEALALFSNAKEQFSAAAGTIKGIVNDFKGLANDGTVQIIDTGDTDNAFTQLNNQVRETFDTGEALTDSDAQVMQAIVDGNYTVTVSGFIAHLDEVLAAMQKVLPYDPKKGERYVIDTIYQSFDKILKSGLGDGRFGEVFISLTNHIKDINRKKETVKITQEWLDERVRMINNMVIYFKMLYDITEITSNQSANMAQSLWGAMTTNATKDANQNNLMAGFDDRKNAYLKAAKKGRKVSGNSAGGGWRDRAAQDTAIKGKDKFGALRGQFTGLINALHKFASEINPIITTSANELRNAVGMRSKAVNAHQQYYNVVDNMVNK